MNNDSVLLIGFGGPESADDVQPFLANVLRGRRVSKERVEEVARHYEAIGGRSPINDLTNRQAYALKSTLEQRGFLLPIHTGMRNWHPFLTDSVQQMASEGIERAIGLIMAPQQCDASRERYQRDVDEAVSKASVQFSVRYPKSFHDHPLFIKAAAARAEESLDQFASGDRDNTTLVFTAHSIPLTDPHQQRYASQVETSSQLVAEHIKHPRYQVAYQSRSGHPSDPWLGPDVNDTLRQLADQNNRHIIIVPIGFVCDHVEVLYDLDVEAFATANKLGMKLFRAKTVNDDPLFIEMLADLVLENINANQPIR